MTDVATWSQILSSIAVLGTLVYLAIEIRQNTAAEHAATRLGINNASAAELFKAIDYPEVLICSAQDDPLTSEQTVRLHAWLLAGLRQLEYTWLQYKNQMVDGYYWEADKQIIRGLLDNPRTRSWWQEIGRHLYGPAFVEEVDALIKDQPYRNHTRQTIAWGARKMAA